MTFRSQLVLENDYSETRELAFGGRSILIAPSAIFGAKDYAGAIAAIRAHATKAAAQA